MVINCSLPIVLLLYENESLYAGKCHMLVYSVLCKSSAAEDGWLAARQHQFLRKVRCFEYYRLSLQIMFEFYV